MWLLGVSGIQSTRPQLRLTDIITIVMNLSVYINLQSLLSIITPLFLDVVGQAYREYASELLMSHQDFVQALQKLQNHRHVALLFVLPEETIQQVVFLSMQYLHGYFAVYEPKKSQHRNCQLRRGLLLVSILGLALKV